jgi:transglutaminase-like putative cysteine protease
VHSEEEIRSASNRAGCRVLELRRVDTPQGSVLYGKLACPDNPATFRFLLELAEIDSADPVARTLGLRFFRAYPRDESARARAIHQWVKKNIWFVREPKETFQSPTYTVKTGAGDCDDHANLLHAIARSAGLRARIVPLVRPNGDVKHAVTQIELGGVWTFAETTVDAGFGENPQAAVQRLGLGLGRDDMR